MPREFINLSTSDKNFFSSTLIFRSLRRTPEEDDLLIKEFEEETLDVDATTDEATEASLSLLDSPGETLRFFRFLRGLPFNFGAENN